jgi:RimJ/RimL family protein N-acetyltransferase
MEIKTARFLLRDFVDDDVSAFEKHHLDARFLEHRAEAESCPGHATELVQRFQAWASEIPRRNFQLAVTKRNNGSLLVGCAGLRSADAPEGTAEFGMDLASRYWGSFGYAAEVLASLVSFGFESLELHLIFGKTVSANSRVGPLAQACGARSVECDTPTWMSERGWYQLEWQLTPTGWQNSLLARRWGRI